MLQFYFLSIVANVFCGIVLTAETIGQSVSAFVTLKDDHAEHGGLKLAVALITFLTGLFKLLSVTKGDVLIIGDLLPALVGLALGGILGIEYYQERSAENAEDLGGFAGFLIANRQIFGFAGIILGILHFLFPGVLFI
jgi:hypothetical protein